MSWLDRSRARPRLPRPRRPLFWPASLLLPVEASPPRRPAGPAGLVALPRRLCSGAPRLCALGLRRRPFPSPGPPVPYVIVPGARRLSLMPPLRVAACSSPGLRSPVGPPDSAGARPSARRPPPTRALRPGALRPVGPPVVRLASPTRAWPGARPAPGSPPRWALSFSPRSPRLPRPRGRLAPGLAVGLDPLSLLAAPGALSALFGPTSLPSRCPSASSDTFAVPVLVPFPSPISPRSAFFFPVPAPAPGSRGFFGLPSAVFCCSLPGGAGFPLCPLVGSSALPSPPPRPGPGPRAGLRSPGAAPVRPPRAPERFCPPSPGRAGPRAP